MLRILLVVLQVLVNLSVLLSFIALLAVVLMSLKVAVQEFLKEFGLKKTVVATMALVFLSVSIAHAGETIAKIEGGNLVYYEKTKEIPNVPNGITAEQAQQLMEGVIPSVTFSVEKAGFYFGLPLVTEVMHSTISFGKEGWKVEKDTNELVDPLGVAGLFLLAVVVVLLMVSLVFERRKEVLLVFLFGIAAVCSANLLVGRIAVVIAFAMFMTVTMSAGGILGLFLRRKKEKNETGASHHLSAMG